MNILEKYNPLHSTLGRLNKTDEDGQLTMLKSWLDQIKNKTIVLGYGSLMNNSSRKNYNNINSLSVPVKVEGWTREWITRSIDEEQTYVGAIRNKSSVINAQAVPSVIDEKLLKREVDYRFVKVHPSSIYFSEKVCPKTRQRLNQ